ncbi:MAG TPA: molybdenum cofactor guanylyltransferase [Verrucomicrobiae bacterium]|jgi:molybdopterin-guanine dinucleotide biosynthesis protein A|nr:molybdenum cofactor guanylyltransferase [Verrucomicrobiae bacterium]
MAKSAPARYYVEMPNATAFVLAGGQSTRMGSDKAQLAIGGKTLLDRALATTGAATRRVRIVGSRERYGGFGEVIEDIYPGCGPLGGIHAALNATDTDLNVVLSVDMPLMTADFLRWLLVQANSAPELIVVPDAAGGLQPLCAVYHREVREAAEQALQNGNYKIGLLFSQVSTRLISEREIVAGGSSPDIFQNINTPEEYESLSRRLAVPTSETDR